MKVQDLVFGLAFLFILWRNNGKLAVFLGLSCLALAIPLFKFWIFFTAERLTWYAAAFFGYAIFWQLIHLKEKD